VTVFGIIGRAASGKSTLLEIAKNKGYKIFNADNVVEDLYKEFTVQNEIKKALNINCDSCLKTKVIENLKSNSMILNDIEAILHPLVEKKLIEFLDKYKNEDLFLEIPLLFEVGWDKYCDKVIFIDAEEVNVKQRMKHRDNVDLMSLFDARQEDVLTKKRKADFVISNNNDLDFLLKEFSFVLSKVQK
jgi:dephospho-CoA kinase